MPYDNAPLCNESLSAVLAHVTQADNSRTVTTAVPDPAMTDLESRVAQYIANERNAIGVTGTQTVPTTSDNQVADGAKNDKAPSYRTKKLTAKEKHLRSIACTDNALETALNAIDQGYTREEAKNIGRKTATDTAKSYAEIMRANNSNEQITERVSASSNNSARGRKPTGATMTAQRHNVQRQIPQYNNKRKHIVQYKKGTGTSNNNSIAAKRPSYLDNKCIVISRVDKDTTMSQFQSSRVNLEPFIGGTSKKLKDNVL